MYEYLSKRYVDWATGGYLVQVTRAKTSMVVHGAGLRIEGWIVGE